MATPRKTKVQSAEISVIDTTNVPSIIGMLEAKIKELDHVTDSKYRTSIPLAGFGDIKSETDMGNLIKAFSSVKGRAKAYADAAEDLGIETYPAFEINGGSLEDWKQDITLRLNIITHKETLDKLNGFKAKFEKFLSTEDQKAMLLSEMAAFLK